VDKRRGRDSDASRVAPQTLLFLLDLCSPTRSRQARIYPRLLSSLAPPAMYSRPNPKKVKKPRFLDSQDRHDSPRVEPQDESVNRHIKWMEDGTAVDVTSARSKTKRGEQSEEPKRKREEGGEVVARAHSDKRKKLATRCVLVLYSKKPCEGLTPTLSHPSLEARSEL
jgi:hypothetical protein